MKNISAAYAKAFAKIAGATKDSVNPHFKSKYADLASVMAAIKPALIENDLFFTQVTVPNPDGVEIETILFHASGEQMPMGNIFVPVSKRDAQGFGSAISYARRYALQTAFGVSSEDDDGNAATANPPATKVGITDAEWSELVQLIDVTRSDTKMFCELYGIKSIRELPSDKFDDAKGKLNRKLANMVKEASE